MPMKTELRATFSLALILAIRMLGLFMILPIFSIAANDLTGATPFLIGLALGIYGLSQAIFQMPLGMLSDKIGRKPIIAAGLLIFLTGSIVAALSTSITGMIIGRTLQGAGAMGSTVIAFVADFTREKHRTKAMALMGMTIGLSFALAMVLGPLFNTWIHLSGIFWLTSGMCLIGLILLYTAVPPAPQQEAIETKLSETLLIDVIKNPQLLQLNFGIFCLHAILTASFIAIPLVLQKLLGTTEEGQWQLYLGVLLVSFLIMTPLVIFAEKKQRVKTMFLFAIASLGLAELLLIELQLSYLGMVISLLIFFTGFNLLEACLPSLISKTAPANLRGTAMGLYSTCQFFGIFIGGSAGGLLLQHFGISVIFIASAILAAIWWLMAI